MHLFSRVYSACVWHWLMISVAWLAAVFLLSCILYSLQHATPHATMTELGPFLLQPQFVIAFFFSSSFELLLSSDRCIEIDLKARRGLWGKWVSGSASICGTFVTFCQRPEKPNSKCVTNIFVEGGEGWLTKFRLCHSECQLHLHIFYAYILTFSDSHSCPPSTVCLADLWSL